jgi:hypothetical protein
MKIQCPINSLNINTKIQCQVLKKYNLQPNPTIENESLHEIINDNRIRVVRFTTPKSLTAKSTMFSHRSIDKFPWTISSPKDSQSN